MDILDQKTEFLPLNRGFQRTFKTGRLSLGLVVPIEGNMTSAVPTLERHVERVQLAERLGFASVWLRDVPFNVPSFGDAGQVFDPFVYLGLLAGKTEEIALGVASVVLPLRHPAHVAKAAASADVLSGGRLLLGVASGDRPEEYPAMDMEFETRGERFRDAVAYIRAMAESYPEGRYQHGALRGGADMLPKPSGGRLPLLITGGSRQAPEWVAEHGDGWMTYPRDVAGQGRVVGDYRARVAAAGQGPKPVMQSLYVDLVEDGAEARPIHLGFQSDSDFLMRYLEQLEALGINHVALNLRFNRADVEETLERLAERLGPRFMGA